MLFENYVTLEIKLIFLFGGQLEGGGGFTGFDHC
jgi:hypothetical protein